MYTDRISSTARYNLIVSDIQRNEALFNKLTAQLASGKKVTSITDDPIAAVNIVNTNRQLGQIETFNQNVGMGMTELSALDDLMDLAGGYLSQAWDKAVQANNGNYGETSLRAIKVEIDEITKTMVDLANTEYNDNYIFGGTNTKMTPYVIDEETGDIIYRGTPTDNPEYVRQTEVADGVFETINVTGDRVFGYYRAASDDPNMYTDANGNRVIKGDDNIYKYENGSVYRSGRSASGLTQAKDEEGQDIPNQYTDADGKTVYATTVTETDDEGNDVNYTVYKYKNGDLYGDGTDATGLTAGADEECYGVMGALKKLSIALEEVINAKHSGDDAAEQAGYAKMNSTLDMFKDSLEVINTEQTKFGGVYNRLEMSESTLGTSSQNLTSYLTQIQEVDLADAISKWYQAQYAYQASLQVAASSMGMSLLNYL